MKTLSLLLALALIATTLSACGQRVYPRDPAGKINDSNAY